WCICSSRWRAPWGRSSSFTAWRLTNGSGNGKKVRRWFRWGGWSRSWGAWPFTLARPGAGTGAPSRWALPALPPGPWGGALFFPLPQVGRRIVFRAFLLVHCLGILIAVMSPPPPSWLSLGVWTRLFRPYLQFMYLNNAYHFYAPDPGPAYLIWFRLEYDT